MANGEARRALEEDAQASGTENSGAFYLLSERAAMGRPSLKITRSPGCNLFLWASFPMSHPLGSRALPAGARGWGPTCSGITDRDKFAVRFAFALGNCGTAKDPHLKNDLFGLTIGGHHAEGTVNESVTSTPSMPLLPT